MTTDCRHCRANDGRVRRARKALASYIAGDPYDLAAAIQDLLADVYHAGHAAGLTPDDWDRIHRCAQMNYDAEVLGDEDGDAEKTCTQEG